MECLTGAPWGGGGHLFNYQIPGRDSGGCPNPLNGAGGAVQENARRCTGECIAKCIVESIVECIAECIVECIAASDGGGRIRNGRNHSGGFEPSRGAGFPALTQIHLMAN